MPVIYKIVCSECGGDVPVESMVLDSDYDLAVSAVPYPACIKERDNRIADLEEQLDDLRERP